MGYQSCLDLESSNRDSLSLLTLPAQRCLLHWAGYPPLILELVEFSHKDVPENFSSFCSSFCITPVDSLLAGQVGTSRLSRPTGRVPSRSNYINRAIDPGSSGWLHDSGS